MYVKVNQILNLTILQSEIKSYIVMKEYSL